MSGAFTICALATAPSPGGVGIVRLSGAASLEIAAALAPDVPQPATPRHAYFTRLLDRRGGLLDEGLFLFFAGPRSFTGEDVVELQIHGGPTLLRLLQGELLKDDRVRPAEPGEFTRRAFLNGRIDLARAEAVADLVAAQSEAAVRAAAAQVRGDLSRRIAEVAEPLRALRADVEGLLNFPDEAEGAPGDVVARLREPLERCRALLAQAPEGRIIRRGAKVVLFGPVNAGKSTLFNRLLGEERALVDDAPGTTRDALEAVVEWDGVLLTLVDTAGLRGTVDRLEGMGIERGRRALRSADLAVLVLPPASTGEQTGRWREEAGTVPILEVRGKADESPAPVGTELAVSGKTGLGVDALRAAVGRALWGAGVPSAIASISERHAEALRGAVDALDRAAAAGRDAVLEVVGSEVGQAIGALEEITGEGAGDALLDGIFGRFCIGK